MDPRTPVIVGAGQVTYRDRPASALHLMEEAAAAALGEAGRRPPVSSVQVVNCLTTKDPALAARLGARLGLPDGERLQTTVSGSTPQWLVSRACDRIASGELDGALIVGAEALHSTRRGEVIPDPPDANRPPDQVIGDDRSPFGPADWAARAIAPTTVYALYESVLAHRAGRTPDEQRRWLGRLMAPFTAVAARHGEAAWFPVERSPEEISTPDEDNRLVGEPYTKRMNAVLTVDQGAALVLLSAGAAEAAGVPRDRWVFPWSAAECDDVFVTSERPDFGRAPALEVAAERLFAAAGVGPDDVSFFDLYSCFPSAVQIGAASIGLDPFDGRGLTVTGGLPYFGGPGSNYVTHALAVTAARLREEPQALALVTGIGWFATKHALGLYSGSPPPDGFRHPSCAEDQQRIASAAVPVATDAEGDAVVEAMTVEHDRRGPAHAPVYARLADGRRVAAAAREDLVEELSGRSLVGERVRIRSAVQGPVYEPA